MSTSNPNRQLPGILLIDDDAISREVFAMMLEMHGFPVSSAEDGRQALEFLENAASPPGVILMDTQMPGISGVRLIKALRQRLKAGSSPVTTRIVAISGSEVSDSIRRSADGFLLKPIQVESLLELLDAPRSTDDASGLAIEASATLDTDLTDAATIDPAIHPIDPAVLAKFKGMMPPAAVHEVYTAVASDLEARLSTLAAAMDAGHATEVTRIAHTIKGGCGMVGLTTATEAAARLESSNQQETWPKELLQLHFALRKLQGILGDGLL
jgi:CheY-like chemotaxis protein